MGGSLSLAGRSAFSEEVASICDLPLPAALTSDDARGQTLLDFEPSLEDGQWHPWKARVQQMEIDTQQVRLLKKIGNNYSFLAVYLHGQTCLDVCVFPCLPPYYIR